MTEFNIVSFLTPESIALVEEKYKAKYIFDSSLKLSGGGWSNFPAGIFYTDVPHPEGSNYFGIYFKTDVFTEKPHFMITNGISATKEFEGILYKDRVYFSRYRHDYLSFEGDNFVDGGRDYLRFGGPSIEEMKKVTIKVVGDHLELVEEVKHEDDL